MKSNSKIELICFLLVLLFVYAAVTKLLDYNNFKIQLSKSPLLKGSGTYIAVLLPLLELLAAGMLIFPSSRKTALVISFLLLLLFTLYITYMLMTEKKLPCSCGE